LKIGFGVDMLHYG